MLIRIDPADPRPLYEQIELQVRAAIGDGLLVAGERMPPARELADEQQRLDLLEAGGDPYTAVRAVFSWSGRHLDADTARAFRLVGLHPRPDFEVYATAALTGASLERAERLLGVLARANLIHASAPGRYSQHDLLRDYARELAAALTLSRMPVTPISDEA